MLQCVEHFQALHDAVKNIVPAGLSVLERLEYVDECVSAAAELCWDTPAFTDSAERVSILGYPVPDRGPVFIDINTGAAKLSVSCVTRISNPFR
ncbi:hypothetical protein AWF33_21965 [Escherichia coli]|nr:hypothetical protein AWF05_12585 [Escherichia coli]KUT92511.1 hypothetical protein AWF09_13625 [Escherichia coli]KUU31299.1 hypothetical protein AWF17_07110 [Escherichia coli]KUU88212.1 hypothetical protein AWF33_21965 [Escherichia coli]KUV16573.1 hypothetical protein AWF37_04290 [Escherichia coli]